MKLSVVIPTLNEEKYIGRLLTHLAKNADENLCEIIVADGGSTDRTCEIALQHKATLVQAQQACRAVQLNAGAAKARGDVLYFVHADVLPPASYLASIKKAVQQGHHIGACRQKFESSSLLLRVNAWFTRFNSLYLRGGDQTIFVTREAFGKLHGFNEKFVIMEEYDLMQRARKIFSFAVLPCATLTSARKYEKNNWLRVQLANLRAVRQFKNGVDPEIIRDNYKNSLH
ncbi:MAG: TIGR04283 family arsenosugar biosynthesis glycosyltransferase [Bacteroidia bacterium]|jgi:rSAM/selenodomain-associated transferase 2|nr:TIGR04283 family arsenosugar biosynthesis glycosyltransferase [Bacteroidia bacterium]